ncbi:MAG: hypothetical protein IJ119_05980 [Clostridia bacterium]|nr:hypothetical protein [Clostridia bacterium]
METMLGFFLGIVASFIAWLLVAQVIKPHVVLSKTIEKGTAYVENSRSIYRVHVTNQNWFFKVFDVQLYGKIMIKGLNRNDEKDIKSFSLIIGRGTTPYINPYRGNPENIKAFVIKVPLSKSSQMGQLKKLYCRYHELKNVDYFGLSEVFDISENLDITLEISVITTHFFSGARNIVIQRYKKEDIIAKN